MDISKSISYRGLEVNGVALQTGRTLRGISVEQVNYSGVETVGYIEKRAASDGMHASDVYLGGRTVDMSGHIYSTTLAEMFDFLHVLRSVFSPTSAYQQSPGDQGFLPMHFQQSTEDEVSFPAIVGPPAALAGVVPLYMNLRPSRPPNFAIQRDRQNASKDRSGNGNTGNRPTAIPWAVTLLAKDPRVYVDPDQSVDISGASASNVAGSAKNRGDYETPFNIMLVIGSVAPPVGSFHLTGLNDIDMTIKIEAKANVAYRWFGDTRVLMTQDTTQPGAPLVLRMDLVSFATKNHRPMVPAQINPPTKPFTTPFTYSKSVALAAGSRLFWSEAFA